MITRLLTLWHYVRTNLSALPLLAILVAVALAIVASRIRVGDWASHAWYLYGGDAGDVSGFLGNLTTAVMTLATLVVSITMVVLTLAAQQLGPRLIESFMSDRKTQAALALFFGTAAYLLVLLRIASGGGGASSLSITFASVLVGLSVLALPIFVHHLGRSIVADNVIRRVGAALDDAARETPTAEPGDEQDRKLWAKRADDAALLFSQGGYIQAIDVDRLVAAAAENEVAIILKHRAGQHVLPGEACAWVRPGARQSPELEAAVRQGVLLGSERTPVQDLEFSLRQLVEVAVRALSPGQNDPYTALAAVDRIAVSIKLIMDRPPARAIWRDRDGAVRLFLPVSTFEGLLDAAFDQIRQYGASQPAIVIRLGEKLAELMRFADAGQRPALEKHLRLVLNAGRKSIDEPSDRAGLERHVSAALDGLTTAARESRDPNPPPQLAERLRLPR